MSVSTTVDINAVQGVLKELYDGQVPKDLVYKKNPFLAMVPKKEGFFGKYKPIPLVNAPSAGRSATFSTAQANMAAPVVNEFMVYRAKDYAIQDLDMEALLATSSDDGAFIDAVKLTVDGAFRAATNSLAGALFRSGTGSVGQIGSISTGVITLADPLSSTQFELNQVIQANATDGGTPRAAVGYVIAVDRAGGTVTVATSLGGSAASPASWAANDFLLVQGDNNLKLKGLSAWVPFTAPASNDSFWGVNRSSDPTRLAGIRYDGTAQNIEEAFISAASLVSREGGSPDVALTNYTTWNALVMALGSKVTYEAMETPAGIGFKALVIQGGDSQLKVVPDRNCPSQYTYLLTLDTWALESMGKAPRLIPYPDNQEFLRVGNADSAEIRVGLYGQLTCNAPGWNAVVKTAQ